MIRRRNPRFYKGEFLDILRFLIMRRKNIDYIKKFEEDFAKYIGTKYAVASSTGRNSLEIILEALNLKDGDEIIFPAFTLKDLIPLIKKKNLTPVLVDIESDSFNIDPNLIEEKITERTKVIIATHLFGLPCNIEKILGIAKEHNLKVIEDCAHAMGAEYKGRKVGSFGCAGFFSFEFTKLINTFEGGMIVTDDETLANCVKEKLKHYPISNKRIVSKIIYSYLECLLIKSPLFLAFSFLLCLSSTTKIVKYFYLSLHRKLRATYFRFTNLQAYIGLKQLKQLDKKNKIRFKKTEMLTNRLGENVLPQTSKEIYGRVFYFFVVRIQKKLDIEQLRKSLFFKGVDVGIKSEIIDDCSTLVKGNYPVTRLIYNSSVQLPMYDDLNEKKIKKIWESINGLVK